MVQPPLLSIPPGISLRECADPSGNGQATVEVLFGKPDGSVGRLGVYFQIYGGQLVRVVHGNPSSCADICWLGGDNGRVQVAEL